MAETSSPREALAEMLRLEPVRGGGFAARFEDFWGSSERGDVLARAALAGGATCHGFQLRSLHASFLHPVPPGIRLALSVEALAEGRDEAHRQVRIQGDGLLCQVIASFAAPGDGLGYQDVTPRADLPAPEDLPGTQEQARAEGWAEYARGPIEFRRVHPRVWPDPTGDNSGGQVEWMRLRAPLPRDPQLEMAALVFLAGFYSHWPFERRIGDAFAQDRFRTLDHALCVHQPLRWDDWWLLETISQAAHAGLAHSRRRIFTRDGRLVASSVEAARVARA